MYLERDLVGISIGTSGKPTSTSKNLLLIEFDENVVSYSTSTSC
jgi:hypothetical protein